MNPNLHHALRLARVHDEARARAQQLRHEAISAWVGSLAAALGRAWRRVGSARIGAAPARATRPAPHGAAP